jgi:hypothetical protein
MCSRSSEGAYGSVFLVGFRSRGPNDGISMQQRLCWNSPVISSRTHALNKMKKAAFYSNCLSKNHTNYCFRSPGGKATNSRR